MRVVHLLAIVAGNLACVTHGPDGAPEPEALARAKLIAATGPSSDDAVVAIIARQLHCGATLPEVVCTGTLIGPRLVLTAAHCLDDAMPLALDVVVGASIDGPRLHVAWGAAHPRYMPETHTHDVAVLGLDRDVEGVTPAPLRTEPLEAELIGASVRLVGYGATSGIDTGGGARLEGTGAIERVDADDLRLKPSPTLTCHGDSGGPVFVGATLIGVTTWGDPGCAEFGMAARVDRHMGFISESLEEARRRAMPAPARRPFSPDDDACASTCRGDEDCPVDSACLSTESGVKRCGHGGLVPGRYLAACDPTHGCVGDSACVALEGDCRCFVNCSELVTPPVPTQTPRVHAGGGGCAHAKRVDANVVAALLVAAAVGRSRRRGSRR